MKVLLVDDHPLILSALQMVIEGLSETVEVTTADSAAAARQVLQQRQDFDLTLLDLELGDASGFDLLVEIRAAYPAVPVVVISGTDRTSDVIRSIDEGAMGFIPKRTGTDVLLQALKLVMSGGIYVPPMGLGSDAPPSQASSSASSPAPEASGGRFQQIQERQHAVRGSTGAPAATAGVQDLGLTPRQTDVLGLLLQGKPNKIIARELGISVETIKDHVAAVLKALGVSSRTQAVLAVGQLMQQQQPQRPLN